MVADVPSDITAPVGLTAGGAFELAVAVAEVSDDELLVVAVEEAAPLEQGQLA
jgi:hypothetical protein